MTGYERLKTIRAVARHYRPAENYESWHVLREKLRQAERALATVAEMVDEYEVMIGKLTEQETNYAKEARNEFISNTVKIESTETSI